MIRWLFVLLLAACSSKTHMDPPAPFQIPAWTTMPSEADIVAAIVGPGGSPDDRADAEAITRDLILPRVKTSDMTELRSSLETMKRDYASMQNRDVRDAFLRFAVTSAVDGLERQATRLAAVRVKSLLWPDEPFPEGWEDAAKIDPATVPGAAAALDRRMKEIEARYRERLPRVLGDHAPKLSEAAFGEYRMIAQVRNPIHVALTGDYSVTSESIYEMLSKRGIPTRQLDVDRPY